MVATGQCTHHWLIDPPFESTSAGHCANCGQERVFDNMPTSRYDREQATAGPSWPRASMSGRDAIQLADEAM